MIDHSALCLGKRPAIYRPGAATLAGHKLAQVQAPQRVVRNVQPAWGLDDNDRIGDCTAVALANYWRAIAALAGFEYVIAEADTVAFYGRSTGYDPALPGSDAGGVEADVLTYQAQHGFIPGSQAPLVALPWDIAPDDLAGVQNTIAAAGGAYLGLALPLSAQTQDVWDTGGPGDETAGGWGGHAVLAWAYDGLADSDLVTIITWGMEKPATWRWLRRYMDEAHGLASPRMDVAGVDLGALAGRSPYRRSQTPPPRPR